MRAEDAASPGARPAPFEPLAVTVHGAGHAGLVAAACLAELGHGVVCTDAGAARMAQLARAELPFEEPGLAELIVRHGLTGRLRFTADADMAVAHGQVQLIAVTPSGAHGASGNEGGWTDVRQVLAAARGIGERMTREVLVATHCTAPVGTADRVREVIGAALARRGAALPFAVASNPAFLRLGHAIDDLLQPARIVVGADTPDALRLLRRLYAPLLLPPTQWVTMGLRDAEFTKYASNTMLAARISLMNDLALLAERLHVDIGEVQRGMAGDARIGELNLSPGCGFGGPGLPGDVRAMRRAAADLGLVLPMLDGIEQANERQKTLLPWHIIQAFDGHLAGRRIALWGLAYKPGTESLSESPSEAVIQALLAEGAEVVAYDPQAMPAARVRYGGLPRLRFAADPFGAVVGADALAIVTDWPEFHRIDWRNVRRCMEGHRVFDGRNVCPVRELVELGFSYRGVGRAVHELPAEVVSFAR